MYNIKLKDGLKDWIEMTFEENPTLYVNLYHGKYVRGGGGRSLTKFESNDPEDAFDRTVNILTNAGSGKYTVTLNSKKQGGSPYTRYVEVVETSKNNDSVAGIRGDDVFNQIGGIKSYLDLREEVTILRIQNARLEKENEDLEYLVENPPEEPFFKQMGRQFGNNPKTLFDGINGVIQNFTVAIAAANGQAVGVTGNPNFPNGTQVQSVETNGDTIKTPTELTEPSQEEVDQINEILERIQEQYFPNKTLLEIFKALEAKLNQMPMLANMLFQS